MDEMTETASVITKVVEVITLIGGPFSVGLLIGVGIGVYITRWVGQTTINLMNESRKLDLEREKELRLQINLKDDRIEKLHDSHINSQDKG